MIAGRTAGPERLAVLSQGDVVLPRREDFVALQHPLLHTSTVGRKAALTHTRHEDYH